MSLCLTEIQIAWIAGLFEGEANFGLDSRSKTRYKISTAPASPFIKISMVDQDVIKKVAKLVNKSCFSPSRKTSTGKTVYVVHIGDRATLSYLLPLLLPHLGERRQKNVQECLDALTAWKLWYSTGGRKEMAKQGALAKKKLVASKSNDMMSPDISQDIL